VGGGQGRLLQPGAASLAHQGILFLDEAPEFRGGVLDALRQPLEEGEVTICRTGASTRFPARFTLVLAANPCPCAAAKSIDCTCQPSVRHRYLARISGPLLDRIDLKLELLPATRAELRYDLELVEPSETVAARVQVARERAAKRLAGTPWRTNAEIPGPQLRRRFLPDSGAMAGVDCALQSGELSARGLDRVLRTAWTCADLAERDTPSADDLASAFVLAGDENVVADMTVAGSGYDGVAIDGADNLIARLHVERTGRCGITIGETATDTGVADCIVDGARWSALFVLGTDTTITGGTFTGGRKVDVLDLGTGTEFLSATFATKSESEGLRPFR